MASEQTQYQQTIVAWICPVCHDVITAGIAGEPIRDYRFIVETGHWHDGANHPAVATPLVELSTLEKEKATNAELREKVALKMDDRDRALLLGELEKEKAERSRFEFKLEQLLEAVERYADEFGEPTETADRIRVEIAADKPTQEEATQ